MKHKIKFVSLILAISICFENTFISLAYNENSDIFLEQNQLKNEFCISTGNDSLLKSDSGDYAIIEDDDYIVPVGELEINLKDEEEVAHALEHPYIPTEVKDAIYQKLEAGAETVTIYSPDLLPQTRSSSTNYFTKDGYEMKSVVMITKSVSTGFVTVTKGIDTKKLSKKIVSIVMTSVGSTIENKMYNLLTTGSDLFTNFIDICGLLPGQVATSAGDYTQINLTYNDTDKFTYAKISQTWRLGLISKRIKIIQTQTCTFFKKTGLVPVTTTNNTKTTQVSAHFKKPGATALKYAKINSPITESVSWNCQGNTFIFR